MQISKDKVVSINYTLKDDEGEILDTSEGRGPLAYIHGSGSIIPGLETALEGKNQGDKLDVKVAPEDGYGQRDDSQVQVIPKNLFEGVEAIEPGMQFQAQSDAGVRIVTVKDVSEDQVTVDANHPLAGMNLNFNVEVTEVRDATSEELQHGHVHGPEGHEH